MISAQNISKSFGPVKAVSDVSFEIKTGEVVGFLGPNGAGKSTTMRILTGFIPPTQGRVLINDVDMAENPIQAKRQIGYLPESAANYSDMEVTDCLTFSGKIRGLSGIRLKEGLRSSIQRCQLKGVLGRKIGDLSKGYRQRVGLAQALLHDPEILVLDEPTVGLDPNQIGEIRDLIRDIGQTKTVLLSTHILSEVTATCGRVMIINDGKIVAQGTPQSLTMTVQNQTQYDVSLCGDQKKIAEGFKSLPGFLRIDFMQGRGEAISPENNLHRCQIFCSGTEDRSEAIFRLAVAQNWILTRLNKETQSLEDVFKKLTQ
jgi:ABC-2 type transport system ATP-binding protein